MKFYEFGKKELPHIMLIHGAGWSYWLYLQQARLLQDKYHIILPVIDGHGEESSVPYTSTEGVADKLIAYIDKHSGGKLFALSGVSMGGQIATEVLSKRKDIARKAIIESAVLIPQPKLLKTSCFIYKFFGKMLCSKSFQKWSLKMLPKRYTLPEEIKELFKRDLSSVKPETLIQIFKTYYTYKIKESLKQCEADTIYWYGGAEPKCVAESGELFKSYVKKCKLIEFDGYNHAEISTYRPKEWIDKALPFLND